VETLATGTLGKVAVLAEDLTVLNVRGTALAVGKNVIDLDFIELQINFAAFASSVRSVP
jgi:hypothetical protein